MDLKTFVRKALLENAIKYEGKTQPNAAMGAVMREFPQYRGKTEELLPVLTTIADDINNLSVTEQEDALAHLGGSDAPEKEERDRFHIEQPNPVLRFEPSPSGPMHIGHAFPLGLNHILAERNEGKLILRIADTNPENIYEGAYELLPADATWYTHGNIAEVAIQSDRMALYYEKAEKMLEEGWAYVCTCSGDAFRELINNKKPCPCRENSPAINLERWELMLTSYEPGDAVMRIKTDVTHKNPAMRDWPAMRINTSKHPRQGNTYRVWPLMNFSVSLDDMEMGMTHILRAKDHADNAKRQEWVYNYFQHPIPHTYFVGKINFTDLKLSTSQTRKLIEEGTYTGWDDIRLPFLPALRRRGFQSEAFLRLALEMGISSADKTVSKEEYFTNIEAFNREIIDPIADRAFFVKDPVKITIRGAPTIVVVKDLHPAKKDGGREFVINEQVIVEAQDIQDCEGKLLRLMDAYNFEKKGDDFVFVSESLEEFKAAKDKRIMHYLPADTDTKITVRMPNGEVVTGIAESHVTSYPVDTLLQFERFGFVRVDDQENNIFWFAHV